MRVLKEERNKVYEKFENLAEEIENSSNLDKKTRELIKISVCVAQGSMFGISKHTTSALHAGARKAEIIDTIVCCLPVCGIASTNQALEAAVSTISLRKDQEQEAANG